MRVKTAATACSSHARRVDAERRRHEHVLGGASAGVKAIGCRTAPPRRRPRVGGDTAIDVDPLAGCKKGETAWVEIPVEGDEEPREPAAMVSLVEAEDEHGAASSDAEEPDQDVALQNTAATTETDDDGASSGLVIVALIVGGLGLITGLAALLTARRRPTA
jgi:hypothetical protein